MIQMILDGTKMSEQKFMEKSLKINQLNKATRQSKRQKVIEEKSDDEESVKSAESFNDQSQNTHKSGVAFIQQKGGQNGK